MKTYKIILKNCNFEQFLYHHIELVLFKDKLIVELLNSFKTDKTHREGIATIKAIWDEFADCLRCFCLDMGIKCKDWVYCQSCGEEHEGSNNICQKCASMKTCPKCKKKWSRDDVFCTDCGARLK